MSKMTRVHQLGHRERRPLAASSVVIVAPTMNTKHQEQPET